MIMNPQLLAAVKTYQMPPEGEQLLKQHPPLIIAGIAASGKNAVFNYLIEHGGWRRIITHTTRPPRAGEVNGKDYWFVTEDEMLDLLKQKIFLETEVIHETRVHGVSLKAYRAATDQKNRPIILLDVQGVLKFARYTPGLKAVFILPPNRKAWLSRLQKRGPASDEEKVRRARSAVKEIQVVLDNPRLFNLVVNEEIWQVASEILTDHPDAAKQAGYRQIALALQEQIRSG